MHEVAFTRADVGVCQRFVYFQRLGFYPFAVLIVKTFLRYFANIDLRIEVCSERFVVVTGITVYNIEVLNFIEVVLGGICSVDTTNSRIEPTAKYGGQTGLFEAIFISPLP